MIVKRFTLFALVSFVMGLSIFSLWSEDKPTYFPRETSFNASSIADGYLEYMQTIKANQVTGEIDPRDVLRAREEVARMKPSKSQNINWGFKGPDNIGGRTRALVVDRNNPDHILAGGVAGGIYESFDGANTWQPYDPNFEVTIITSLVQDAAGDFYVGTGSHFESGSSDFVANQTGRGVTMIGSGLYKLTGNGSFEAIRTPDFSGGTSFTVDWASIGEVIADPNVPEKLYVAANQGYRVLERINGNWVETSPINYDVKCLDVDVANDGTAMVIFKDNNSNAQARVYTSSDGQQTWDSTSFPAGRIEGDIAESSTNVMYLSAARTSGCLLNVYRSSDGGKNWDIIGPGGGTFEYFGNSITCQGYWDNLMVVSPTDAGKIFVGGITLYTWEQSSTDPAPPNGSWRRIDITLDRFDLAFKDPRYVHADKHDMIFDPSDPNTAYIITDGGVTKSENMSDPQPAYRASNFNFGATQYYNIAVNSNDVVLGGTQDNGAHLVGLQYNSGRAGLQVQGGDGFGAELSTINPSIGVSALYFNYFRRIQGIDRTLGATNISRADIVSNNTFLGGVCNVQSFAFSCGGPFYTVIGLWESFDHQGSRDSVEIQLERSNLPPIPADTVFEFGSNNNNITQIDTLRNDAFPTDTLFGAFDEQTLVYEAGADNRIIANFDTIVFDVTNRLIAVLRRGFPDTLINYTVGQTYAVANVISNNITLANGSVRRQPTFIEAVTDSTFVVRSIQATFFYRIKFQDKVQSIFASPNWAGLRGNVTPDERNLFITRDLLKNRPNINWYNIAGPNSTPDPIEDFNTVLCIEFSRDGNHIFVGTSRGDVYRISDVDSIYESNPAVEPSVNSNLYRLQNTVMAGKCRKIGEFTGRAVTDLSVDPNDANNLVVVLGNYGNNTYVARTNFALTAADPATTFSFIQGSGATRLPSNPAYSVLIDKNNSDRVLVGTDNGIFATENAFSAAATDVDWSEENQGLGRVPVFDLEQMVFDFNIAANDGKVYAGTHARGIFETEQFVSINENENVIEAESNFDDGLKIYPNPVSDYANIEFKMSERADVRIQVYSLNGRLIMDEQFRNQSSGENTIQVDLNQLSNGTYIVRAISGDQAASSKLLIHK